MCMASVLELFSCRKFSLIHDLISSRQESSLVTEEEGVEVGVTLR